MKFIDMLLLSGMMRKFVKGIGLGSLSILVRKVEECCLFVY